MSKPLKTQNTLSEAPKIETLIKNEADEPILKQNRTYIDDIQKKDNYNPVFHTQVFTHRRLRTRTHWEDPSPTVVPGLAPSISAIMAQQKMGLPNTIATRTLEAYYKNMDLTDIEELNNTYLDLAKTVEQNHKSFKFHQDQARLKQQQDAKRITDYLDQQKIELQQAKNNGPLP